MVTNSQGSFPLTPSPNKSVHFPLTCGGFHFSLYLRLSSLEPKLTVRAPFTSLCLGRRGFYFLFTPLHAVCQSRSSRSSEFRGSRQGNGTEAALSLKVLAFHFGGWGRLQIFLDSMPAQKCIQKKFKIYPKLLLYGKINLLHHLYALRFKFLVFYHTQGWPKSSFKYSTRRTCISFTRTWGICCTNAYL